MEFLNSVITPEMLVLFLFVAFLFNDGEELLTMERWIRKHRDGKAGAIESRLINWQKPITAQFAVAVCVVGVALLTATYIGFRTLRSTGEIHPLFTAALTLIFLDGVKHVGLALLFREYSSGAVTAALVQIPYGAYALHRFLSLGLVSWKSVVIGGAIGVPAVVALVFIGFWLGRSLVSMKRLS